MRRASRTACRCSRSRPSGAASAPSTSRAATRTSPASRASARPSSPCTARKLKQGSARRRAITRLGAAASRSCRRSDSTYDIIVTGVGGTGVVTIGGILGMAAHLEGKGVGVLDMAGLAQKGGAVYSHMRIAERPEDIHAIRDRGRRRRARARRRHRGRRQQARCWPRSSPARPTMVVNTAEFLPGDFTRNADFSLPTERLKRAILGRRRPREDPFRRCDARSPTRCSAIPSAPTSSWSATPISSARSRCRRRRSSRRSSSTAKRCAMNKAAFRWGRRAVVEPAAVEALVKPAPEAGSDARRLSQSLDEMIAAAGRLPHRLSGRRLCARAIAAWSSRRRPIEAANAPGKRGLAEAVARYLFKLMAYKDEYEVARLYTDGAFVKQVKSELGGENLRLHVPSRAAAARAHRQGHRRAEEDHLRPVDIPAVPAAGEVQVPARHGLRSVRLFGRAQDRARSWCATTRRCSRKFWRSSRPRTTTSRSGSPPSRRRSAASATSSCATSRPPRPTRRRCSTSSAPGPAPLLKAAE